MTYVAIWSLRRGVIDPPEPLSPAGQELCAMAQSMQRKPVQSADVEDLWREQGVELAQEQRVRYLAKMRQWRQRKRLSAA